MGKYLLRRSLIFIPTLLVITLLAFGLSKVAPGDPVYQICEESATDSLVYERCKQELGLQKPDFYFSLSPKAYPKNLQRFSPKSRQDRLKAMIGQYGNWTEILAYEEYRNQVRWKIENQIPDTLDRQLMINLNRQVRELESENQVGPILGTITQLKNIAAKDSVLMGLMADDFKQLGVLANAIESQASPQRLYYPDFKWYGFDNQYQTWLNNFIRGDFGRSYQDKRGVVFKVKEGLFWTLLLNLLSFVLAFGIAIPLGVTCSGSSRNLARPVYFH